MPIPSSPRAVFATNVLVDVLCQVQFPTILAISATEPAAFQEMIREGYPLYRKDDAIEIASELRELLAKLKPGTTPELLRHVFTTADSKRNVFLTRDFLAVQETSYVRWERFEPEIVAALNALTEIYRPPFLTRVGLRYQDIVDRSKIPGFATAPWRELINPQLIGLLGDSQFSEGVDGHSGQISMKFDEVAGAKIRINHGLGEVAGKQVYVFDADFYLEQRTEVGDVRSILDCFHRASGNLFRWAISRRLYDALEPNEI